MPIYEYQCPKCGTFEVTQRITESPLRRCPTCKGRVTKLISSTSFQLKGSGWYVTDYAPKGDGGKDAAKKDGAKTESSGEAKTPGEAKPAKESPKKTEATAA